MNNNDLTMDALFYAQDQALKAVKGMPPGIAKLNVFRAAFTKANIEYIEKWGKENANLSKRTD